MLQTIREVAKRGIASESFIRRLVAQGQCPGVYSGTRFLVNVPKLIEYIDAESVKQKGKGS